MSTQDITKYSKDTKHNILKATSQLGDIAYATDTGELMIRRNNGWFAYTHDEMLGTHTLSGTSVQLNRPVLCHLDATATDTIFNNQLAPAEYGQTVRSWRCPDDCGPYDLSQSVKSRQPTYVQDGINGKPAVYFTGNKAPHIGTDLNTERPEQNTRIHANGVTCFIVMQHEPKWKNWNDVSDVTSQNAWGQDNLNEVIPDAITAHGLWGSKVAQMTSNDSRIYISQILGDTTDYYMSSQFNGAKGCTTYDTDDLIQAYGTNGRSYPDLQLPVDPRKQAMILAVRYGAGQYMGGINSATSLSLDQSINGKIFNKQTNNGMKTGLLKGLILGSCFRDSSYAYAMQYASRMKVGEFLLFDGVLSNNEFDQVGAHLATKWEMPWSNIS